jgi:HK97 family phage major capsid protein
MFVYKSENELNEMTSEQRDAYLVEKREFETAEVENKVSVKVEEATKGLKDVVSELELEVKSLKENKVEEKGFTTIKDALLDAFEQKRAELDQAINGRQSAPINIEVKAAVSMQVDNTIGAGSSFNSITQFTGVISPIRQRELRYLANVSVGRTTGNQVYWIEEKDEQGTPIMLGEGDTKTQLSVRYEEATMSVKKIAVYGKVTTEMMADLPQLISYIENNLMKRMDIVAENQLLAGNGLGDNLKGAKTYATAFTGGTSALKIDNANEFDVISALSLQCQEANGMPNAVFVHPQTLTLMKTLKSTLDGQYLYPRWADSDGLLIDGLRVIPSLAVTANEFIGGDLSVLNVLFREELALQIGLDGSDFINNKKTMLVEKRLAQYVSANDTAVLIKGDFTTAKAAIEKP